MFEKYFKLSQNGTTVKTEIMAGITTFMTMAYILAVNPSILGDAGMVTTGEPTTGEPFAIAVVPADMVEMAGYGAGIFPLDGSAEITLSIVGNVETVTPMPAKYLPPALILYSNSDRMLFKTKEASGGKNVFTKEELHEAIEQGRNIYVFYSDNEHTDYEVAVKFRFCIYQEMDAGLVYTHDAGDSFYITIPKVYTDSVG